MFLKGILDLQALINEKYIIEIVENRYIADVDDIRCAYDRSKYPNLQEFFNKSVFNKDWLSYKDKLQSFNFQIIKCAFNWLEKTSNDLSNADIILDEQLYGSVVHDITLYDRKKFIENYAYGHIEIRKVD